jgi:large subunit ribosomal protein L32e
MSKDFPRKDTHKAKKLSISWRKPRGLDNKTKHGYKGYVRKVKIGYGTAKTKPETIVVACANDILSLKTKKHFIAIFSSTIGDRKKSELLKLAGQNNIKISNVKQDFEQKLQARMTQRKEKKLALTKKKDEKKKESDKKSTEKQKDQPLETKLSDDEKKKQEKDEKDKILTQKEGI